MQARTTGVCGICGDQYFAGEEITWNRRSTSPTGERYHQDCFDRARKSLNPTVVSSPVHTPKVEVVETVIEANGHDFSPVSAARIVKLKGDLTDQITLKGKHNLAGMIKDILSLRRYPFLYGNPGAGKTYLVRSLADDMGLDFVLVSCSADMLKSEILGSKSPLTGDYHLVPFRNAWEKGGVILFDECGIAPGSFLNLLNSALEQKEIRFPDGERVEMHPDCFIIFADNSALYGNDPLFPERQDVGGAFRDRLTYVEFEYDEGLEYRILCGIFGDSLRASNWHSTVKSLRSNLGSMQLPVFASPRFAYRAAEWMSKKDWNYQMVVKAELYRGVPSDIVAQAKRVIDNYSQKY